MYIYWRDILKRWGQYLVKVVCIVNWYHAIPWELFLTVIVQIKCRPSELLYVFDIFTVNSTPWGSPVTGSNWLNRSRKSYRTSFPLTSIILIGSSIFFLSSFLFWKLPFHFWFSTQFILVMFSSPGSSLPPYQSTLMFSFSSLYLSFERKTKFKTNK